MSEELRDELTRLAKVRRLKVLGFGLESGIFTGNAAGVSQRQAVKYEGVGVFNVQAFCIGAWAGTQYVRPSFLDPGFTTKIMDQNLRVIWPAQARVPIAINGMADLIDDGILLKPQEYLIFEFTNYMAQAREFGGCLVGEEFIVE